MLSRALKEHTQKQEAKKRENGVVMVVVVVVVVCVCVCVHVEGWCVCSVHTLSHLYSVLARSPPSLHLIPHTCDMTPQSIRMPQIL